MANERAAVVMLHGGSSDRLRQALGEGLVRNEIRQEVENTLAEADQAKYWADTLAQQNWELQTRVQCLQAQNEQLKQQNGRLNADMNRRERNWEAALKAAQEKQQRRIDFHDTISFLFTALTIFTCAVAAILVALTVFYYMIR